jgi:hypothetical protein
MPIIAPTRVGKIDLLVTEVVTTYQTHKTIGDCIKYEVIPNRFIQNTSSKTEHGRNAGEESSSHSSYLADSHYVRDKC